MAYLELNALSTVLCGSFSAKIFLPEMDRLQLDDEKHEKKYPVLWLLHSEGGTALDFAATPAEKCAVENGIFIIAPDAQHSLCSNMVYGPKYEEFLSKELPGICRNNLPISEKLEDNWIGGVGTGAYGAVKAAIKYPDIFSKCIAINGIFDMDRICQKALKGEPTGIWHTRESLMAVFGDIEKFSGSENDVFALAKKNEKGSFYFSVSPDFAYQEESSLLAGLLKGSLVYTRDYEEIEELSLFESMIKAAAFVCGGREE